MNTIVNNLGWFLLHYAVLWIGGTFIVSLLIKLVCKSRIGTRIFGKNISKLKLYAYSFVLTVAILGYPWVYFLGGFKGLIIDEKGYPIKNARAQNLKEPKEPKRTQRTQGQEPKRTQGQTPNRAIPDFATTENRYLLTEK